jgi:hypothetical protein
MNKRLIGLALGAMTLPALGGVAYAVTQSVVGLAAVLTRIFEQLGVTDRTQAALWARENLRDD